MLYPNMYCIFVGHPGVGKGRAINPAISLVRRANTVNIMSDKITIQYILERLATGFTTPQATASGINFTKDASCLISAPEMEVFLTTSEALPSLSELWESKDTPSDYGTRGKGLVTIQKSCPSLLGGMTLRQVVDYMSTRVVSGGFTRRVNFVYAANKAKSIARPTVNGSYDKVTDDLVNDLRHISTLRGKFQLSPTAWPLFEAYYHYCGKVDEFEDEVVAAYTTSKGMHAIKLAMCLSASRDDTLVITDKDIQLAIDHVEMCANDLMKVFRAVGESDLTVSSDRVLRYIEMKGFVTFQELMAANWRHINKQELEVVLSTLESGYLIAPRQRGSTTVYTLGPEHPINKIRTAKGQTIQ